MYLVPGMFLVCGVYLVLGGAVPGHGGVPGTGEYVVPGGCTWSQGGVPGTGGSTWSRGLYLVLGVYLGRYSPPWTESQTPVKILPCPNFVAGGKNV